MSNLSANITLEFDPSEVECGGRAFEVEETDIEPGAVVVFNAWGINRASLKNLSVRQGCDRSLGSGIWRSLSYSDRVYQEKVSFSDSNKAQLTYPIGSILRITAMSEFVNVDVEGNAECMRTRGSNMKNTFSQIGSSCIGVVDLNAKLNGSANVHYLRSQYVKSWYWTVPNVTADFIFYVFDDQVVVHKEAISVEEVDTGAFFKDVTIFTREYTSLAIIPEAEVIIDGSSRGYTDSNGLLDVSQLEVGEHTIKVVKSGYIATDEDDLDNEKFTVS